MTLRRHFKVNSDVPGFIEAFKTIGTRLLHEKRQSRNYIIDEKNNRSINMISQYMVLDPGFVGDLEKGLLLFGSIGSGKTMTMEIISEMMIYYRMKINIIPAVRIVEIFSSPDKSLMSELDKAILIIDDLGVEETSINIFGTIKRPLCDLINERYNKRKLTFITTNLTRTEIASKYGDRIMDRLFEMCNYILLDGVSRRK